MLCSTLWMISGRETLSSKLPDAPPMATSLPITCAQSIVIASDCVGLTLPGMIELPGSFSGMVISPRPGHDSPVRCHPLGTGLRFALAFFCTGGAAAAASWFGEADGFAIVDCVAVRRLAPVRRVL